LTLLLLLTRCGKERTQLDGVWILAYSLPDNKPEPVFVRTLMDFDRDSLHVISVGNLSTGNLRKVQIEKFEFRVDESSVSFDGRQFKISYSTDSLILQTENSEKLIYKRLNPKLKTTTPKNCFKGAYVIKGDMYQDSICFVNDSTLIHTGDNDMNFPTKKWNIVTYKDFQFLNIQDIFNPLTVIKSCTADKVTLMYNHQKELEFIMTPTSNSVPRRKLIGQWTEIPSTLRPTPAPLLVEGDQYYHLTLNEDSIQIKLFGRTTKLKWDMTADGKRIYFRDKIFKEEGSWKLLALTDSTMTFRQSRYSGLEENIVKLKRDSNGR
jgi:hypothetical protein